MSGPGRERVTSPLHWVNVGYSAANYYLLTTRHAGLLIDVGWPGTLPRLRGTLARAGSGIDGVTHLMCTHYHPDHAGLAEELKLLGVRLLVLENQCSAILAMNEYLKNRPQFMPVSRQGLVELSPEGSRSFLADLGIHGGVVATPGHTDDSVSLVLDSGAAFTGDLPPATIGEPGSEICQSWETLRALGARTVLPGHGPSRGVSVVMG